jgi:hypothetical protein
VQEAFFANVPCRDDKLVGLLQYKSSLSHFAASERFGKKVNEGVTTTKAAHKKESATSVTSLVNYFSRIWGRRKLQ